MRYLLNSQYALRSFIGAPHCYYEKGIVHAQKLRQEEYDFLILCDGKTELEENAFPSYRVQNMVHPAEEGETLSEWQRNIVHDNRYFPGLIWMITGRCNYNCRHCFNAADLAPLAEEWSYEDAMILLDEAKECGVNAFTLTGGEPMLHKRFLDIVKGIYERDMFLEKLNTNGAFITEEILHEFQEIGARPLMKISFDGLGSHDWLRSCNGAEETTLEKIRLCVRAGLPVKVQFNINRKSAETVMETMRLLEELGVREVRMIRTSESPRWEELGKGQTLSFREYYSLMTSFAEEWLKTPHTIAVTIWHMERLPLITAESKNHPSEADLTGFDRLKRFRPEAYVCSDCRFMISVTSEGDLVPCLPMSGYFSRAGTFLGNIKGGGLKKMLKEGAYLDKVSQRVSDLIDASVACSKCRHFLECQGGCRAIAIITTGEYLGPDLARCIYYKEGYAKRLHALFQQAVQA